MKLSIRKKIALLTLGPIALVYLLVLVLSVTQMQRRASRDVERYLEQVATRFAAEFDGELMQIAQIAATTATFAETQGELTADEIYAQLRANVEADDLVYGAAMAFERGAFPDRELFSPYVFRDVFRAGRELAQMDIAADAYDYTDGQWEWWTAPRDAGAAMWTEPYFDEGAGDILMCTFSAPFHRDGAFRGITTVDIPLEPLQERVRIAPGDDLDFVIVTGTGRYVFHRDPDAIMSRSIVEDAERSGRDDVAALARQMTAGKSGVVRLPGWETDERQWVVFAPIASTGWSFAAHLPEREAIAEVRQRMLWMAGGLAASFALIAVSLWFVSGLIARPLEEAESSKSKVEQATLGARIESLNNRLKILVSSVMAMSATASVVGLVAIVILYTAAREEQTRALADTIEAQVALIKAVARFDKTSGINHPGGAAGATISQIVDAHSTDEGLGETGEILVARDADGVIDYLVDRRHAYPREIERLPVEGAVAAGEPMRLALSGRTGAMIARDYRDERVLAAYAPVEEIGIGIVAKMDLREVRQPFVNAAIVAGIVGLLFICGGVAVMVRLNDPLIRQVEDSETHLRTILSTSAEGFWFVDTDMRTLDVNPAMCDILGRPREEVVGHGLEEFLAEESKAALCEQRELHRTVGGGAHEVTLVRPDGTEVPSLMNASPYRDQNDRITGSFAMVTDITTRKQAEAAMERAREAAEAANRAKSEFLSNMSHELRTPLNGVLGYAQILRRDASASSKQRESLDAIESCGQHLLTLINDVLDLSKIEAGRLEIDKKPCDFNRLLKSVFDIVRPRAEAKDLDITMEVSDEVPACIVTDSTKLKQTLVNLLGNAVKFTHEGEVRMLVSERRKGWLEIQVVDTGIGMTPDELEHVFDPFKQAEGGKSKGGTGLGLPISKKIVEALGGYLVVTSEKGVGSRFVIELPLVEGDAGGVAVHDDGAEAYEGVHPVLAPGQDVTLLVVDDRQTNRDILVQMLGEAGFHTVEAEDGAVALERMREQQFPLVLMDVRMPVMNGIEAVGAIRKDPALRGAVVIAVTASVFPEFRDRAKEAGFDDFIGKPLRAAELFARLERHLGVTFVEAPEDEAEEAEAAEEQAAALDPGLAAAVAERLREPAGMRNLTALTALADELGGRDDGSAPYARRIGELARSFDFEGLDELLAELDRMATT